MLETFKSPEKLHRLKEKNSPVETSSPDKRKVYRLAPLRNRMRGSLAHEEIEPTKPGSSNQATLARANQNINRLVQNINESLGSRYDGDDEEMQNIMEEVGDIIALCNQPRSPAVVKKVKVMKNSPSRKQLTHKKRSKSEYKGKSINWIFTLSHTSNDFKSSHKSRTDLNHRKSSQQQLQDSSRKLDIHHRNLSRPSIPLNESKATRRTSRDSRMTHTHDDSPEDLRHSRSHARFGSTSAVCFHPDPLLYFNNDAFYRTPPKPLQNSRSSKDLGGSSEKAVLNKIDSIIKMMRSTTLSVKGQCACSSSKLGDGVCDEDCYSEDCEWDNEDCKNAECVLGCLNSWIGDSTCHNACYVESCQYDNGDCQTEECAVGCRNSMVGDNTCQENCFNQACNYDSSDCQKCAEECAEFQIGDGVCQRECFNKDCDWDKQDCGTQCATGCEISYLGNKKCEAACNNSDCNNDEGDCIDLCSTSGCRSSKLGNGVCDKECNISVCEYDAGDCTKLSFFSKEYNVTSTEDEEEEYEPDNFGKVGGVGLGVMLTIIACIVGVLLCIIGAATPYKLVFLIIGICIPLIVFLVVALAPTKKDVEDEKDDRSDKSMVPRYIILAMLIVASLIGALRLMEYYLGINVKARRVDSRINNGPAESDLLIENADSAQVTSPNNQKLEIEEEIPRGFPKFKEVEMEEFSPFTSDSVSGRIPKRYPV